MALINMPFLWLAIRTADIVISMACPTYADMSPPQREGEKSQVEEGEMTKTTFRMPKSLLKDVQRMGIDRDMTDTEIFNQAIRDWIERQQKKEVRK